MKIIFITRLFYPHVGGVEKHVERVGSELIKKGYEVTVLTTKFKREFVREEIYRKLKIIRFYQPKIRFLGLISTWVWLVKNRRLLLDKDIIHIHDVFIWYWPLKLIYPKKSVFLTYHGRWGKYPITLVDKLQKKIGAKYSSGVICIGDYIPKNYGIKADFISYGAVDTPAKKFKKENRLIIYVGRLDNDIALAKILKVFEKLKKEYEIVFVGDGAMAGEAKKIGKVTGFTDPIPYYKRAKYLFASGYLTILEGLAYRCRIFTMYENRLQEDYYKTPNLKRLITISGSYEEILKKFIRTDIDIKKVEQGYKWVKDQNWEKMSENYLMLWKYIRIRE